jgi:Helicase HerA, central domain
VAQKKSSPKFGELVLGWTVDKASLAPVYWTDSSAPLPGSQSDDQLIKIPANALGCHTAIIAQSGSGKSFFLGRLIEELMLASKARCVVLDPNADFRRVKDIVDAERWKNAGYDTKRRRGFLPHEESREEFEATWTPIVKRLRGGPKLEKGVGDRLKVEWSSLSHDFLADNLEPMLHSDLYHCHEFVKAVITLVKLKHSSEEDNNKIDNKKKLSLPLIKANREAKGKRPEVMTEVNRILRTLRAHTGDERRLLLHDMISS